MSALWSIDAMADAMQAERAGNLPAGISGISIDSRTLSKGDAFFAIQGDNRDGHDFVDAALKAGAGLAVVAKGQRRRFADAPLLIVDDALEGLRALARAATRAPARQGHRGHRFGRQDHDQGGAAARAVGGRRNARIRCLVQQSLGRSALAGALSGIGEVRRVRDRHESCRRNNAADEARPAARRRHHRDRAGASGVFRHARKDRRCQGGDFRRRRGGRRGRAQPRQCAVRAACGRGPRGRHQAHRFVRRTCATPMRGCCAFHCRRTYRPWKPASCGSR